MPSRGWSAGVLGVLLLAAPLPARAQASCNTLGQTTFVRDTTQQWYYWYREVPDPPPAGFESPEAYLEAVRYRPLDSTFSYITLRAANDAFFSESQFIGIGITTRLVGDEYWVAEAFPDGPAAEAGLSRGARFLEIGGRSIADYLARGDLGGAFGPSEVGVSVAVRFLDAGGAERSATLTKRLVTIPTVSETKVLELAGARVGYMHFRNFVTPSTAALSEAFATLRAGGASELVLDLRYNGGGLVSVAQHLGGLIGGARTLGQVFAVFFHNDKNQGRNQTLRFEDKPQALGLRRLVVITTRASASASELIINALRPFMPVTVVGDTTFGKPVGQYGFNFCEKVYYPVAFQLRNAQDQGDFFGGFAPDCPAADDLGHPLGDPNEASLAEALSFVRNGACSAGARSAATVAALAAARVARPAGWQSVLNAY